MEPSRLLAVFPSICVILCIPIARNGLDEGDLVDRGHSHLDDDGDIVVPPASRRGVGLWCGVDCGVVTTGPVGTFHRGGSWILSTLADT